MEPKSNNSVIWLFLCFSSFWCLSLSGLFSLLSLFSLLKGQKILLYEYSPPNPRIRVLLRNAVCVKFGLWIILSFSVFLVLSVFLVILVLLVISIFSIFPVFSVFVVFSKMLTRPKWLKRMKRLKGHQNHKGFWIRLSLDLHYYITLPLKKTKMSKNTKN